MLFVMEKYLIKQFEDEKNSMCLEEYTGQHNCSDQHEYDGCDINPIEYKYKSKSDCESLLKFALFNRNCIEFNSIHNQLDAEFACIIYNEIDGNLYVARDPFGVRPLFMGTDLDGGLYFASEAKAIAFADKVVPFLPGHYLSNCLTNNHGRNMTPYYKFPERQLCQSSFDRGQILACIRGYFIEAVKKRTMSDRVVGCLLSGGLDSSLVASILHKFMPEVHFYSIGLEGSVDVAAAKKVISYLNVPDTHHHCVQFTVEQGFDMLDEVICQLESYDITTIRASVPQYLLAKYIRENTPVSVIFSGEGSDELLAGYSYFKDAPDKWELQKEIKTRLQELYLYDNLRTDRTTAKWSLEVRVPFLDKNFVNFILQIDPGHMMSGKGIIEKKLLRDAFKGWLPDEILYRPKEAFSDAVSSKDVSWYRTLQGLITTKLGNVNLEEEAKKYPHNPPKTIEALYYRQIFEKHYPGMACNLIPKYWMPKWQPDNVVDPSATVLGSYKGEL
jgi:asparagine synthase (glutamine-hydrolysing)